MQLYEQPQSQPRKVAWSVDDDVNWSDVEAMFDTVSRHICCSFCQNIKHKCHLFGVLTTRAHTYTLTRTYTHTHTLTHTHSWSIDLESLTTPTHTHTAAAAARSVQ
jgi:hypothetical protein